MSGSVVETERPTVFTMAGKPFEMNDRVIAGFWNSVKQGADDECWEWTGFVGDGGYGMRTIRCGKSNHTFCAHRIAYELLEGRIPDGLQLDHVCRNRACVNPAHLEPVTARTNLMRGETPTAWNAAKTHCKHGHEFTPANTIRNERGNRTCAACQQKRNRIASDKRRREREHERV